jgi:hypothetical protein
MKLTLSLFVSVVLTNSAFALEHECYKAINPEVITIVSTDSGRTEPAKTASVKISIDTKRNVNAGMSDTHLRFKAKSKTLRFDTYSLPDPSPTSSSTARWYVECDGGALYLSRDGDNLVLNSQYLAGEVSSDLGCGNGQVTFENLRLEKVRCGFFR